MHHPRRVRGAGALQSSVITVTSSPTNATLTTPSPTPTASDSASDVQAALIESGLTVASIAENPAVLFQSCGPGQPLRMLAFYQEPPHASLEPGEKPPIDELVFASTAERRAYEARISGDGTQLSGPNCSAIIDSTTTPHWSGGGPYLLLVVSDDPTVAASVAEAAGRLGSP